MLNELIKNIMSLGIITADDVKRCTTIELLVLIIERLNGLYESVGELSNELDLEIKSLREQIDNILTTETTNTIVEILQGWLNDGTIEELIDLNLLNSQEARITKLEEEITIKPSFTSNQTSDTLVGCFFQSNSDINVNLYTSSDGVNFKRISENPVVVGRDPSILYHNGKYYIAVTNYNPNDFVIYESDNLKNWAKHSIYCGLFNQDPQATKVWAPEFFKDGEDVYVIVSVRNGSASNIKGQTVDSFDTYLVEMDLDRMQSLSVRKLNLDNQNKIDGMIIKNGLTYHLFIKDEYDLCIERWSCDDLVTWVKQSDNINVFDGKETEGCCVAKKDDTFYLYVDCFYEPYVYVSKSKDLVNWEPAEPIRCKNRTRHGSVIGVKDANAKMILNDLICSQDVAERNYSKCITLSTLITDEEANAIDELYPVDTFLYQSFAVGGDIIINKVVNKYHAKSFSVVLRSGKLGSILIKSGGDLEIAKDILIKPDLGNADVLLTFEYVDEIGKFKPTFFNNEILFSNQSIRPGFKRTYLDDIYETGTEITELEVVNGMLYTVGGENVLTISGLSSAIDGDRIYVALFSDNASGKLILKTGKNLTVPGGTYEISVAQGNNEKIIELVKCWGTTYRLMGV